MRARGVTRFGAAVLLGLAACSGARPSPQGPAPGVRRITVRVVRPPPVNLYDRGVAVVGVIPFSGPSGPELARRLARQLARTGAYRVVGPDAMDRRLMKAGLAVRWDETPSALRWVHDRVGVDAVIGGRVERFSVEGFERRKQTLALEPTGEYGFVWTEEGKLAYREKMAYRPVPLFCRTDWGTVGARYRVWDVRRGEVVATLYREITATVPSFCYRGDVPDRLIRQAQERLLRRLFTRLNDRFLGAVVPGHELQDLTFELADPSAPASLVRRNELGLLFAARGRWQDAIQTWESCLAEDPDLPWARYNLAMALRAVGRLTEAAEHLRQALVLVSRERYREAIRRIQALACGGQCGKEAGP